MEYKAFISYRHAPADIAVAKQIQRELERFRIPKSLRQRLEIQKIGRIFRDQEELSITSDLSRTISDALDHAEFLIVICSTATAQSTWVTREIRQFLKTHDPSRVLTVLVDGEPDEVIPSELLHETVPVERDGSFVMSERKREHLSCDYRKTRKRERRAELLRLAAPLLGCSYDELAMRERQYKRRRTMTAALVAGFLAAAAITYLTWSLLQIRTNYERAEENYALAQKNYIQALQSQSEYLSGASLSAMEDADRTLALHLALAALPEEGEERSVLPVTEDALSQAVEAYSPRLETMYNYRQIWNFQMPGQIVDWITDPEGRTLYALDENGNLAMWDLETFQQKTIQPPEEPDDIPLDEIPRTVERYLLTMEDGFRTLRYPGDGNLYCVNNSGALLALDPETCAVRWTRTLRDFQNLPSGELTDCDWIYTATGLLCAVTARIPVQNSEAWSCELCVLALSPEDGAVTWKTDWMQGLSSAVLERTELSEDGRSLALVVGGEPDEVWVFSLEDETLRKVSSEELNIVTKDLRFSSDGQRLYLYAADFDENPEAWNEAYTITHEGHSYHMLLNQSLLLAAFDLEQDCTLWQQKLSATRLDYVRDGTQLLLRDQTQPDGTLRELVGCALTNTLYFFDPETGELIQRTDMDSEIVAVRELRDRACVRTFLYNGESGNIDLDSDSAASHVLADFRFQGFLGVYVPGRTSFYLALREDGCTLSLLDFLSDPSFEPFSGTETVYLPDQAWSNDRYCVIVADYLDPTLYVLDLERQTQIARIALERSTNSYSLCGADETGAYLYVACRYPMALLRLCLEDGTLETMELPDAGTYLGFPVLEGAPYAICQTVRGELELFQIVIGTDLNCTLEPVAKMENVDQLETLLWSGNLILLHCSEPETEQYSTAVIDAGGSVRISGTGLFETDPVDFAVSPDGSLFAVLTSQYASVYDRSGALRYRTDTSQAALCGGTFCDAGDQTLLLTLRADGKLSKYDASDGTRMGSCDVSLEVGAEVSCISAQVDDGTLYLRVYDHAQKYCDLNLVDLEGWHRKSHAAHCLGISIDKQLLYCWGSNDEGNATPGTFPLHTVEDYRAMAKALLKGHTLSEEDKAVYGLR